MFFFEACRVISDVCEDLIFISLILNRSFIFNSYFTNLVENGMVAKILFRLLFYLIRNLN